MNLSKVVRENTEVLSHGIGGFGIESNPYDAKDREKTTEFIPLPVYGNYACKLVNVIVNSFQRRPDKFGLFASRCGFVTMLTNGQVSLALNTRYCYGGTRRLFHKFCTAWHFGMKVKELVVMLGQYPDGEGVNSSMRFTDDRNVTLKLYRCSPDFLPYGEESGIVCNVPYSRDDQVTEAVVNLLDLSILGDLCCNDKNKRELKYDKTRVDEIVGCPVDDLAVGLLTSIDAQIAELNNERDAKVEASNKEYQERVNALCKERDIKAGEIKKSFQVKIDELLKERSKFFNEIHDVKPASAEA
jgi:hypothetical protein